MTFAENWTYYFTLVKTVRNDKMKSRMSNMSFSKTIIQNQTEQTFSVDLSSYIS